MKHFKITILVSYEDEALPEDIQGQLADNVVRCVENAELLNDGDLEAIIVDYDHEIEERV